MTEKNATIVITDSSTYLGRVSWVKLLSYEINLDYVHLESRKSLNLSIAESRTESRTYSYRRKSTWCGWESLPALLLPSHWSWRWFVWNIFSWFVLISISIGPKSDHYLPSSINETKLWIIDTLEMKAYELNAWVRCAFGNV